MYRPVRLLLLLVFALSALTPAALRAQTQPATTANGPATEVLLFEPYGTAGLNPDVSAKQTLPGLCDQASQVDVNRPDAWACKAGGKTYDPCFANADNSQLACVDLPSVSDPSLTDTSVLSVVLINPTEPLDTILANSMGLSVTPFLLQLVDGQFCVFEPRDVRFASLEVYGYCSAGYWFGTPDQSKPLWMLPVLQRSTSASLNSLTPIGVRRVWY